MDFLENLKKADLSNDEKVFTEVVGSLKIYELEELSISSISSLKNGVLKDLLNDALTDRLRFHIGGSYTTAPDKI